MKIIFIRHGENSYRTGKLTLRGKIQTCEALRYLKNEKIDAVYCSPRTRTLQTANILNRRLKKPFYIIKEFNERHLLTPAQKLVFQKEYDENYMNYTYESDNFETCKDFIDRILEGLKKIVAKYKPNQTILIVAHSSTLYGLNAFINGIPKNNQVKWLQCNNGAVIKFFV